MWANVAITSHMSRDRLEKFAKKVTAFYGPEMGVDLTQAEFGLKAKHVEVPTRWEYDLRHRNMAAPWRDIGVLQWRDNIATLHQLGDRGAAITEHQKFDKILNKDAPQ
jgi:hypothetical protein